MFLLFLFRKYKFITRHPIEHPAKPIHIIAPEVLEKGTTIHTNPSLIYKVFLFLAKKLNYANNKRALALRAKSGLLFA